MRQRLDINKIYVRAFEKLPASIDDQPPLKVPQKCPVTLDDLLSEP